MRKCWYKDKNLAIFFDRTPDVRIRYVFPSMSEFQKRSIKKYPFLNNADLRVRLEDRKKKKEYCFTIPKYYTWDGMSIPWGLYNLIASKTDNRGLVASLLHDYLCEHKGVIDNSRSLSTNVFNACLKEGGINPIKRCLMKNSVACFQTLFCGWGKDNK